MEEVPAMPTDLNIYLQKPSSRWTKDRSCTNIHTGPLKGGPPRFVLPALRRLAILDLCVLVTPVTLLGNRDNRSIDDLATHRQVTLILQIAVEVLKQGLNRASLCQLLPVQPYRLGIGDFVLKP